ncbi:hypothetical protein SH611_20945 [Geminicoccaceae bacterium 1502E]|nr:hypothetical protein [Geminicoccaceae bacterium 1502E]
MSDYYDLGTYSRKVTAASPEAQLWCDRGLVWAYGFNHDESIACFEKAIAADPDCAFAWWGVAYASGCNYNKPWEAFDADELRTSLARAHRYCTEGLARAGDATAIEVALLNALARRYQSGEVPGSETFSRWNDDYADAMREVHRRFPDDLDVTTLFAEALMNRTPWALWDLATGGIADGASTGEAKQVMEKALERPEALAHPGLLHMYIHLMEMSPEPERALKAADALRDLVPDAGHLQHMPTHIDVLCGHYERVLSSNDRAIRADRNYLERQGPLNFYSLYRCHNYHFKIYGAMWLGQYGPALATAREMVSTLPEELLLTRSPPMADWLEGFVSMTQHVYIRFGKWQEIIDQAMPANPELFCVTTAMMRYAKAVAFAASGRVPEAEEQAKHFEEAFAAVPESRMLFNNSCRDILAVAREMMLGEVEYRKGNLDAAFAHLRRSVTLDDGLPYDEPWGWMQPTRHALAALLLEQGRVEEAAAVYREDLGLDPALPRAVQHPDNVWSLTGYHDCLERLGRREEATIIMQRLTLARGRTDLPVRSSCFCKTGSA